MRNLIIYELEADYANYLQSLGAPSRLVRKYAYRNAVLPQMSGLALALGVVVGGAIVTEIVFGYPGIGSLIITAIQNRDYFLLQGIFLFIIVGVLIANFIVDIAYVIVDPRTRTGFRARSGTLPSLRPRRSSARRRRHRPDAARPETQAQRDALLRVPQQEARLRPCLVLFLLGGRARRTDAHRP